MSQITKPDIPESQYVDLVRFITEKVQEGSRGGEGIYHKLLTKLYLDAHLDANRLEDEYYIWEQTRLITKLLRYLLLENILKVVRMRGGGTSFVIHERSRLADDDEAFDQSNTSDVDGVGGGMVNGLEQIDGAEEETQEGLTQSSLEAHANAYADMTRLAASIRAPTMYPITAPAHPLSNKRTREVDKTAETADSYAPTVRDSLSPRANSARPFKRHATPEEMRRQSAPSRILGSPNKANSPLRRRYAPIQEEEDVPALTLKEEQQKRTLSWGDRALEELRRKFPGDPVHFVQKDNDEYFHCIDCDRSFACSQNKKSMHWIQQHLKSNVHSFGAGAARERRRQKALLNEAPPPSYLESSKSNPYLELSKPAMATEWYIRPIDIQCFSLPSINLGEPSPSGVDANPPGEEDLTLKALHALKTNTDQYQSNMTNCMGLIARETSSKSEKLKLLEGKIAAMEEGRHKVIEDLQESIAAIEKKYKARSDQDDQKLAVSEFKSREMVSKMNEERKELAAKYEAEIGSLRLRLETSESEYKKHITAWEKHFASSEEATKGALERTAGKLAISEQWNQDKVDKMWGRIETLEAERRSLNDERDRQDKIIDDVESNLQIQSDSLNAQQESQEAIKAELLGQIKKGDEQSAELFRGLQVETSGTIEALVRTRAEEISSLVAGLAQANSALEKTNDRIRDPEREIAERIKASKKASEDRISSLEGTISQIRDWLFQATQRVETLEQDTFDRISSLETSSVDKIKSLEEVNDKQNTDYNNMYELVTTMMQAHEELERKMPSIIKAGIKEHLEEHRRKITIGARARARASFRGRRSRSRKTM